MKTIRTSTLLMLLPSLAVFGLVFVIPLSYLFIVSFWRKDRFGLVPDATLDNYVETFDDYSVSLWFTFWMATVVALITVLLAFSFAYVIRFKAGRYSLLLLFAALITLFGGYLSKIYVWKTILGETGILNTALLLAGILDQPTTAFLYNPIAVVITLTHFMLPLAVLPIYGSLRAIDDAPLRAARDLGASPFRVFRDIVLPQCRSGIVAAFALAFLFAAGDWVTPKLVGGPYTSMFGTFIEFQYGSRFNRPMGSAMAFVVIAFCVAIVAMVALAIRAALRPR
jgi:spermidine/putrescine transport system permease protein